MKNLIFKELKLAVHPLCYIFVAVFPLMLLIPSYPSFIGFIYVASCYPILFLGTNKGQQSNDLYYTALLPVRKKDIVLARFLTCTLLLVVNMILCGFIAPLADYLHQGMADYDKIDPGGFSVLGFGSVCGFTLIAFVIYDLFYFSLYYKNGKSVLLPTLLGMLIFMVLLGTTTLVLPLVFPEFKAFGESLLGNIIILISGIVLYIVLGYITYKHSSNLLEKVDL